MSDPTGMSCQELVELITDYIEGTLPDEDRGRFDLHLSFCGHCREYLQQMRLTIQALGTLPEDSIPDSAKQQLLQVFRDWKQS